LTTAEYLRIFTQSGFKVDGLIFEISGLAVRFKKRFPHLFDELKNRYGPRCAPDDFLIKTNIVRLKKPHPA